MKDIDYATAVARVKINENRLLDSSDIDRLIGAKTLDEAVALLNEKGYSQSGAPISRLFDNQLEDAWKLIKEIAPDFSEFYFLLVKNDFHNLKAVLKGTISGKSYDSLIINPTITPVDLIKQAIDEQRWSILPDYMQNTAKAAYEFFVNTSDGQLSDICIDKGSLEAVVALSKDNKDEFLRSLGDLIAATYNLRIAVRCSKLKMDAEHIKSALCENCSLDSNALSQAAARGIGDLTEYIGKTKYSEAAAELSKSIGDFEKWCDNSLIKYVEKARYSCFGAAPLAAYIIKKEAELKTVRIIISGKTTGMDEDKIRRLIRQVY